MSSFSVTPSRRRLAPEVVQTSAMDCGPPTLKCLLEGHGIPVSYGRLREAGQTDVVRRGATPGRQALPTRP